MRRAVVAGCLAILALLGSLSGPARAADDGDRSTGRDLITRQIEAFRHDDAASAFAFASPGIREMFGGSERSFLDMVQRAYPAVNRPRSFTFGPARDVGEGFEQSLAIQDEQGADWDAVYSLERQPDGSWKISGCRMVKRPGEAV